MKGDYMSDINLNVNDGEAINLGMNTAIVVQGSGTDDYEELVNLPSINSVELVGNKTAADLGLANASDIVQEVFWATYNTTTPAQLEEALTAGKLLVCKYNNVVYQYVSTRLVAGKPCYIFLAVGTNATISAYVQCQQTGASSFMWSNGTNRINGILPSGGTAGQILKKTSGTDYDTEWANESGGGGTSDYADLTNKPSIESVTLSGNKTASDLGLAKASDIPTVPSAYTSTPAALGTAAAGSSTSWAKGDHVHAMPSASDVGAAPAVTEVTISTAGAVTQALDPGKIYHFTGAVTSLSLTLNAAASGQIAQYHFDFESGSTAATVTITGVSWAGGSFVPEASKRYECDILNGYGVWLAW